MTRDEINRARRVTLTATEPLLRPPTWALLERETFAVLDAGSRAFAAAFCTDEGALRFEGEMDSRDGVDDFYEAFMNWPQLYLLGGPDDLLERSSGHWESVTSQLTALGMVQDEFDRGYDWFHIGEGLPVFYQLCMADPRRYAERAARFAELYVDPARGNYDADLRMIRAPHNGALGARFGLNDDGQPYPWRRELAEQYGYPLDWLHDPTEPLPPVPEDPRVGEEMHRRLGVGDVAINLASIALVANAHLLAPDRCYVEWCRSYLGAWQERAAANDGLIPDNVGPDGKVGSMLDGRWYGGHYGWSWPHGAYSVGTAVAVGAVAGALVTRDDSVLDLPRALLETLIEHGHSGSVADSDTSLVDRWRAHLGADTESETFLVPYRHSDRGWFDFNPIQTALPVALWLASFDPADRARLQRLQELSGYNWTVVRSFCDKEQAGHEEPWLSYLAGENPDYPEEILQVCLEQSRRRRHLIGSLGQEPVGEPQIHRWQRLNPVLTEALVQLTWGAPQPLYNGGLPQARVRWFDPVRRRPGLPEGVAVLVRGVEPERTRVEVVNLEPASSRQVLLQAGTFGEDVIESAGWTTVAATWGGGEADYAFEAPSSSKRVRTVGTPWLAIDLPPRTRMTLTLRMNRNAHLPSYLPPWERDRRPNVTGS